MRTYEEAIESLAIDYVHFEERVHHLLAEGVPAFDRTFSQVAQFRSVLDAQLQSCTPARSSTQRSSTQRSSTQRTAQQHTAQQHTAQQHTAQQHTAQQHTAGKARCCAAQIQSVARCESR